jgi:transcriptional regulator with XRE-family HTH domain
MAGRDKDSDSLLESLRRLTEQIAGGTLDFARNTATLTAMFGESWLRNALLTKLEPERLEAMADAGHFLRDARETAGMSLKDLSESLGLSDRGVLEDIESGETIMPLELMLRSAALLARHDPIPFLIKFMRTYNPALEKALEQWGVLALPKQYERERRFVNLVRQHDVLRRLSDTEYDRFIHYMESSSNLVLDVMRKEKQANAPQAASSHASSAKPTVKAKAGARKRAPKRQRKAP